MNWFYFNLWGKYSLIIFKEGHNVVVHNCKIVHEHILNKSIPLLLRCLRIWWGAK